MQRVVRMSITYARRLSYCAGACQSISRARSLPCETDNGRCSASNAICLCVARVRTQMRVHAHARVRTQCAAWCAYLAVRSNSNDFAVILTPNNAASFVPRAIAKNTLFFLSSRAPRACTARGVRNGDDDRGDANLSNYNCTLKGVTLRFYVEHCGKNYNLHSSRIIYYNDTLFVCKTEISFCFIFYITLYNISFYLLCVKPYKIVAC